MVLSTEPDTINSPNDSHDDDDDDDNNDDDDDATIWMMLKATSDNLVTC